MKMSVLVPTYRRPADLRRCLNAIAAQTREPDQVIVVCRHDDGQTLEMLSTENICANVSVVLVHKPGVVVALNTGIDSATGDIIAITDDDAAPRSDWLSRIEQHFGDRPEIGGLGGRDFIQAFSMHASSTQVGIIKWFGRQIHNHHLGVGGPRYVDMLKGVNMSFRLDAIGRVRFDERLRGTGAQAHNELAFSLAIRRKGWRLLYDPAVAVDHYPAQRFDEDQRSRESVLATSNAAYNETLTLLEHLPAIMRPVFILWAMLIGARDLPGIIQAIRLCLLREREWVRLPAVLHGRFAALRTYCFSSTAQSALNE